MSLSKKKAIYFNVARDISKMGDFGRIQIGCVVVYKHRIISTGYNSNKTDTLQRKYNVYRFSGDYPAKIHAETMALKPLMGRKDIDFKKVELYVYREAKSGEPILARPCPSCMSLIKDLGIQYINYTTYNGYSEERILA